MADPVRADAFDEVYARYLALPEGTKAEIVAGGTEIRVLPRPRARHVKAATRLGRALGNHFDFDSDGPGGWVVLLEPELRLGDEIRAPDLAGWRVERYVEPDDGPFLVVPDWICEVLSPTTTRYDRGEKLPLYALHHVSHVWLVDPALHTLEVYRREGELWLLLGTHSDEAQVCAEPFDAVPLDLGRLWRLPG